MNIVTFDGDALKCFVFLFCVVEFLESVNDIVFFDDLFECYVMIIELWFCVEREYELRVVAIRFVVVVVVYC